MIDVMIIIERYFLLWAARQIFFLYRHERYIRRMKQLEAEIEHLPPTLSAHLIHLHKINALWGSEEKRSGDVAPIFF